MTERRMDPFQDESERTDSEDGFLPEVDLQLGGDEEASGSGDEGLAELDEENLYGNDVIVEGEHDDTMEFPERGDTVPGMRSQTLRESRSGRSGPTD